MTRVSGRQDAAARAHARALQEAAANGVTGRTVLPTGGGDFELNEKQQLVLRWSSHTVARWRRCRGRVLSFPLTTEVRPFD